MAKRKLNRRLVVILVVVGVAAITAMAIGYWVLTNKDPADFEATGDEALARGDLVAAQENYGLAIRYTDEDDKVSPEGLRRRYKYADASLRMANEMPELTLSARDEHRRKHGIGQLMSIIVADPTHQQARKRLLEALWPDKPYRGVDLNTYYKEAPQVLQEDPNLPKIQHRFAQACAYKAIRTPDKYDKQAVEAFNKALKLSPENYEVWSDAARHESNMGRYANALRLYRQALEKLPESAGLHVEYAKLLQSLAQSDQRILTRAQLGNQIQVHFNKAIQLQSKDFDILMALAAYSANIRQVDRARQFYMQAIEVEPTSPQPWLALASLAKAPEPDGTVVDDLKATIQTLQQGRDKLDSLVSGGDLTVGEKEQAQRGIRDLHVQLADSWALLARMTRDQQRQEAIREARKHLAVLENDQNLSLDVTQGQYAVIPGKLAIADGELPQAVKHFETAFQHARSEKDPARIAGLGKILFGLYLQQQAPTKAREVMLLVRDLPRQGSMPGAVLMEAMYEHHRGRLQRAIQLTRDVLNRDPDNPRAQAMLRQYQAGGRDVVAEAQDLIRRDQPAQAIQLLESAFDEDPTRTAVLSLLANLYTASGQNDKRTQLLDKAIAANPDNQSLKAMRALGENPSREQVFEYKMKELDRQEEAAKTPEAKTAVQLQRYGLYRQFDKDQQARELFARLQQEHPESPRVIFRAMKRAAQNEQWDQAMQWAQKAVRTEMPNDRGRIAPAGVLLAHARALIRPQDGEEAPTEEDKRQADRMLFQAAADFESAAADGGALAKQCFTEAGHCYRMLADLREHQRDSYLSQADDSASKALELDENYAPAVKLKLDLAEARGSQADVRKWLDKAHEVDPRDTQIALRWLNLRQAQADDAEMIRRRELFHAVTQGQYPENTLQLARLYERQEGMEEKAQQAYRHFFASAGPQEKIQAFIIVGRYLLRSGQRAEMQKLYTDLMQAVQDDPRAELGVRRAYIEIVEPSEPAHAREVMDKLLENPKFKDSPELLRDRARNLAAKGLWDQALQALNQALQADASNSQLLQNRVGYLIQAGRYDQASRRLDEMDPDNERVEAWKMLRRADILEAQARKTPEPDRSQKLAEARALIDQAVKTAPKWEIPLIELAQFEMQHGELFRAIQAAEDARSIQESQVVLSLLASLYRQNRQYHLAESILRTLVKNQPTRENYQSLAQLLIRQKDWSGLNESIRDARRIFRREPVFLLLHAEAYQKRMADAMKENRTRVAIELRDRMFERLQEAAELAPGSIGVWDRYLAALMSTSNYDRVLEVYRRDIADNSQRNRALLAYKAAAQLRLGQSEQAYKTFAEAVRIAESSALPRLVELLNQNVQDKQAMRAKLRSWRELRPDDTFWLYLLGTSHLSGEKPEPRYAKEVLQAALNMAQEDSTLIPGIYERLGMSHYYLKEFDQAEASYLEALNRGAVSASLLNNLAYLYAEDMDQPAKALPFARRAARQAPDNDSILDTYAWALVKTGQVRQAVDPMRRALELSENPKPLLRYHMGFVREQLKQYPEARREYREALTDSRIEEDADLKEKVTQGLKRVEDKISQSDS
jgi:tetratricopeptide (TPR) repeat protein